MSKKDREYEYRMQGMQYALSIAEKEGVEALRNDLKKRNFYANADIIVRKEQIDDWLHALSSNLFTTIYTMTAYTLNQTFGFGETRLKKFYKGFSEEFFKTIDYNFMGNKYVSMTDYAVDLNEKYNLGIDVARVDLCEETTQIPMKDKAIEWTKGIIHTLNYKGYTDAADYLAERLENE